jgi:hypothetical protein
MLAGLVPIREGRIWPRAVKKTRAPFKARGTRPAPLAQHGTRTVTITPPGPSTPHTADQPKQPAQATGNPPLNSWHWVPTTTMWQCRGSQARCDIRPRRTLGAEGIADGGRLLPDRPAPC